MADVQTTQGHVLASVEASGGDVQSTQSYVLAAVARPAEFVQTTGARLDVAAAALSDVQTTSGYVLAAVRGRVDDPQVRAWTYTLDGHDFYILRLGTSETLVYDTLMGQWYVWGSDETNLWRAYTGANWQDARNPASGEFDTNVVVGDDGNGALYFLSHTKATDDDPVAGSALNRPYPREFQGQVVKRGYDRETVYAVELLGSIGKLDDVTLTDVTLSYSDDRGKTYIDAGTVTVPNGSTRARVDWRSLGSFTAPGRMFKIVDRGSLQRIDSLTIDTNKER